MADDIVQELRDWQYIVDGVQGSAVVVMLSGVVFGEAADEIERLQIANDNLNKIIELLGNRIIELEASRG